MGKKKNKKKKSKKDKKNGIFQSRPPSSPSFHHDLHFGSEYYDDDDCHALYSKMCEAGVLCPFAIESYFKSWLSSKEQVSLADWLGMTDEEVVELVRKKKFPERLLKKGCSHGR